MQYSTDEDARQAMQLNGGKIKEIQVSLLLSSRAEMQKVIEKARIASASSFMGKAPAANLPSASSIASQFAKKQPDTSIAPQVVPPQPPVISLTNFLAQSMQQAQIQQNPSVTQAQKLSMMNAYQTMSQNEIPGLGGMPSTAGVTSGLPAIPVGIPQTAAAYANYYAASALMDPSAAMGQMDYMTYVAQMAGLQNATKLNAEVDKKDNLFKNKDPRRRSTSRDRDSYRRHRSRSTSRERLRNDRRSRRSRSKSRDNYTDSDKEGKDSKDRRRRTRFSSPEQSAITNSMQTIARPSNMNAGANSMTSLMPPSNGIWDVPPPQIFPKAGNKSNVVSSLGTFNSYSSGTYNGGSISSLPPPTRNQYQTENKSSVGTAAYQTSSSSPFGNIGTCVKVSNIDNETFYGDIRRFFGGQNIGQNDIKFVNDDKGQRTGIVLIRFVSSDAKKQALTKNGWQLKTTQVMITSVTEDDFENGMDSANRRTNNNYNNRNYDDKNDRSRGYKERSRSPDRNNDRRDRNNDRYDNQRRGQSNNSSNRYGRDFQSDNRRDQKSMRSDDEEKTVFQPDEKYTVLIIDDLPRTANEPDIIAAFPNIQSIVIDRYKAFVKFISHDAAKVTLENRFIHYIMNKRVFLDPGNEAQYEELVKKFGKFDNPESDAKTSENDKNGNAQANVMEIEDNDDRNSNSNSMDSMNQRDPRKQNNFYDNGRDPRQRNLSNDRFSNGPPANFMKTDCVIMKNMDPSTNIEDVELFYKDIGIYKMRVHILLDKQGQPCGDCFVEFKYPNDSQRALVKNNQMLGPNRVQVMLIPREQVEAVLSSFGGGTGSKNDDRPAFNNTKRDWEPPSDFGSPNCVVMLSNLCYRATIDDILDEFHEFNLRPEQIIRRYNDDGRPTGNACINFNSPNDATHAIETKNAVKLLNRPVYMKRV